MVRNISQRSLLIVKNIIASFFVKGWSAVIVLLMVPLTLKMLGAYSNGVWLTISGILIWIDWWYLIRGEITSRLEILMQRMNRSSGNLIGFR